MDGLIGGLINGLMDRVRLADTGLPRGKIRHARLRWFRHKGRGLDGQRLDNSGKPRTVAIAFCSDSRMEAPLHVAASSLLLHLAEGTIPHFYMLLTGFSEAERNLIRRTLDKVGREYRLTLLPAEKAREFLSFRSLHGSHTPYHRLLLPDLIDEPRVLYLDADTLPMDDVTPLFTAEMGTYATGFIVDGIVENNLEHKLFFRLGRTPSSPMFNSGVMLFNPGEWKRQKCWEQVIQFLSEYGEEVLSHDQTVLNALFAENCFHINPRFNIKVYPLRNSSLSEGPGIYHFLGNPKPWDMGGRTIFPHARPWFEALKKTALPFSKKTMWLNTGYWHRAPRLIGGYKRVLRNALVKSK
jgi:lipopolysaccharide biosynthesis glycosyltransferase